MRLCMWDVVGILAYPGAVARPADHAGSILVEEQGDRVVGEAQAQFGGLQAFAIRLDPATFPRQRESARDGARGNPVRASNIAIGTPAFSRSAFNMKSNGKRAAFRTSSPPMAAAVPALAR